MICGHSLALSHRPRHTSRFAIPRRFKRSTGVSVPTLHIVPLPVSKHNSYIAHNLDLERHPGTQIH